MIVEMVLAEGDIAHEKRDVDIFTNEHRAEEFLAINPAGWVPALITPDGVALYETPAICLYLAEQHGLTHIAPRTDEPERGLFLSGLFYLTDDIEPPMKRYFYPQRFAMRAEDNDAVERHARDAALERIGIIDKRLGQAGPYHLGERYSLVDLILAYWCTYFEIPDLLAPYPAVKRCNALVRQRPKLGPAFQQVDIWQKEYAERQV